MLAVIASFGFVLALNFLEFIRLSRDETSELFAIVGLVLASAVALAILLTPYLWLTVVMFRRGDRWIGFGLLVALLLTPLTLGTACFALITSFASS